MKKFNTQRIVLFKAKPISEPKEDSNISTESENGLFPSNQKQNLNTIPTEFLKKKKYRFNIEKNPEEKNLNEGRWNLIENIQFFEALDRYGVNWKKISDSMPTRNVIQIRAHAQKFFNKLKMYKNDKLGIDLTLNSIHNINDAIEHIKSKNSDYDLTNILLNVLGNSDEINTKQLQKIESTKNKKDSYMYNNNTEINNNIYNNFNNFQVNNNLILNRAINNDNIIDNIIYNYLNNSIVTNKINKVNYYMLNNYLNYFHPFNVYNNSYPANNIYDNNNSDK